MIPILKFKEMLLELQADVNQGLTATDKRIDHVVLSPTESHAVKRLNDLCGVILLAKMADSDTSVESVDSYKEDNHILLYLLEKVDPGSFDNKAEMNHYAQIQEMMKRVKLWLLHRGMNGSFCGGDETLSNNKAFHTEWEYQYAGFNGLSISFDLIDFSL